MKSFVKAEITLNEKINSNIYKMQLVCPEIAENAIMGQFINIYLDKGELILPRPISIGHIEKTTGEVSIYYQAVGKGTEYMTGLTKGKILNIAGPLGNGFAFDNYGKIALLGGGIGVPPMYSAAREIKEKYHNVEIKAFLGFRSKGQIILEDDFKSLNIDTIVTTDDGSYGAHGNALQAFSESGFIPDCIFACGPYAMLKYTAGYAMENNIPCQVSMEERMACGIGACFGCAIAVKDGSEESFVYKKVCKDGPVFHGKDVVWK